MKSVCLLMILSLVLLGCSTSNDWVIWENGPEMDRTETAAVTGAVVGGGLGAIVGSQTGSTGGGLVVGTAAGAGIGALVGNELQNQEDTIEAQQEQIARQERQIRLQQSEIDELRNTSQDKITYKKPSFFSTIKERVIGKEERSTPKPSFKSSEKTYSYAKPEVSPDLSESRASVNLERKTYSSHECREADSEARSAEQSSITAEKLYHYRRALRLCPENPALHTGLSRVYIKLNRFDDAKYELKEALKKDPAYGPAQELMNTL